MKKLLYLALPALIICITLASFHKAPPAAEEGGIKWMTWQQMQDAQKKEKRKVVVDVYTSWCGWCKRMDAATFTNPEIVKFVNEKYYAVKFDAETKETIMFKGKEYKYVPGGRNGYNELAAEILNGQMSYPTTVYFDEQLTEVFPVPGYQEPKMFEKVLNFVHSGSYKTMQFAEYEQKFEGKVQ